LSPPWGGPSYSSTDVKEFNIEKDMDLDGFKIFDTAKQISQNIAYFLPRNTSVNQVPRKLQKIIHSNYPSSVDHIGWSRWICGVRTW